MAVQAGGRAPYASTSSILTVINKHRQVGLQSIDLNTLQRIGVTEALAPRTLQSLILLDFYDVKGQVQPAFDTLRKVGEPEFKPKLAELLQEAYAEILTVLDPATATFDDVENAFRGFEPTGQLGRMVQLFIGLFRFVDLMPKPTKPQRSKESASGTGGPRRRIKIKRRAPSDDDNGVISPPTPELGEAKPDPIPPVGGSSHSQTVNLRAGGTMTLIVDVNPISLKGADRDFFYQVIDLLDGYDEQHVDEQPVTSWTGGQPSGPN
jgi:hypothetical protein